MEALKILIIEEEKNIASEFRILLENNKIDGIIVNNGIDAYKSLYSALDKYNFDYIITNIGLPDENGVDIIKFISNNFTSKIIIYTSKKLTFFKKRCEYDYYFKKNEKTPSDIINLILKL